MMDDPIVTVKQGKLKGVRCQSVLGPTYLAFRGIPFAAPPIGELRFKNPQPPIPWSGIRDASVNSAIPAQYVLYLNIGITCSEDCLYLNVYTRSLTERRAVIVFIHGGSFLSGGGNDSIYGPDYLITQDVVLVFFNHRLGVFGFLDLEDKVASSNLGLRDAIAALKWVKENIENFGGDPDNITIMGESSGGILVHCLTISPVLKGKGLFHKAIAHGVLQTQPYIRNGGFAKYHFRLASALGESSKNPKDVVTFLRKLPWQKIVEAQHNLMTREERACFQYPYGCVVDDYDEEPVLPLPIDQLLPNDTDIPYLIGNTSHEFIMFFPSKHESYISAMDKGLMKYMERHYPEMKQKDMEEYASAFRNHFLNGAPASKYNISGLIELYTELCFIDGVKEFVERRREQPSATTYVYKFSYDGTQKSTTDLVVRRAIRGASHLDDSSYLFYQPQCKTEDPEPPAEGTRDRIIIERMIRLWTNFAKTGNPTPAHDEFINVTWDPVSKEKCSYLDIENELEMKELTARVKHQ